MLMGAAEILAGMRAQIPGTVVFLFQPAEEGASGRGRRGQADGAEGALKIPAPSCVSVCSGARQAWNVF
jgi:amidohydrolase